MEYIAVYVDVPVASFRQSRAKEYGKTYSYPPHSTVYGLLLSLVGEMDMQKHCGVKLAIAMLSQPEKSKTLRILHRFKFEQEGNPGNKRPNYQEVLTDIRFIVYVQSGKEKTKPSLPERLKQALLNPESVNRWGVLFLGESDDLVNVIKLVPDDFGVKSRRWLVQDNYGEITLPYWVEPFDFKGTRWLRYRLQSISSQLPPESAWTTIQS